MSPQHGNLFLIGYRCTGKSAVAALIAEGLGWSAVDADAVLENECGRSIREIFAEDGEPAFRDRESDVLAAICSQQRQVVATGGGVILRQENRRLLKESGKTVWLTAEPATIWRRMQGDATTTDRRPNLTVGGLAEIEQLLAERMPLYEQCAHWKVATDANSPEDVAREILQLMINDDQIEQG